MIDSLNNALQKDNTQKYWSKITQEVTNLRQTTNEIDNYVTAAFENVDSLDVLISLFAPNNKVKRGDVDYFVTKANQYLKALDNNYRPFSNYLENKTMYFDYKSNRLPGNNDYYELLDNYIFQTNDRQEKASGDSRRAIPSRTQNSGATMHTEKEKNPWTA